MTSLSANMKILMSASQINASELARRTGIAQPIIHRLSTGQNTNPKLATIQPISRYFMITVSQLIGEIPLPNEETPLRVNTEHEGWKKVPLLSWEEAIVWPESSATQTKTKNATYVTTDINVSHLAYSLKIHDTSLEPLFPEGTTFIVEPNRKPEHRNFVLVRSPGESKPQLKQMVVKGNDRYLKSLPQATLNPLNEHDHFLGVMTQAKVTY
ncbi:MAG: transcriptional regulator [Gammaproteobacteria bacterium RIFCSPHIGHO2_12_FULL_41_15]|nr:MAG: transcriptional regulator [Gammaproteobacteria bacterium RIFCSPHIGHO2_12_FULL_41_15]